MRGEFVMIRRLVGLAAGFLMVLALGCGSNPREGTDEQTRDPAWVQAKLKAMDQEASIKPAHKSGSGKR